jgi:hypothetical protein
MLSGQLAQEPLSEWRVTRSEAPANESRFVDIGEPPARLTLDQWRHLTCVVNQPVRRIE